MTCQVTHRSRVDEDDDQDNEHDNDQCAYDVPLVEFPNDELESLPGRCEPQEGGGRTAGGREGGGGRGRGGGGGEGGREG